MTEWLIASGLTGIEICWLCSVLHVPEISKPLLNCQLEVLYPKLYAFVNCLILLHVKHLFEGRKMCTKTSSG